MKRLLVLAVAVFVGTGVGYLLAQAPAKKAGQTASAPQPAAAAQTRPTMPPIPNPGFAPGRPLDQTRQAYEFAALHPEILKYVPCYCGCESDGHPHNESCFVKRRDSKGNVTEWDPHGFS
jgi:hypothetical protein